MSQGSGARILVIDDEPGIVRAVQTNLGRHDFRVDTANTGKEGLEAYARLRPDLVLLDLGLPDMDGLEVIREIRQAIQHANCRALGTRSRAGQSCGPRSWS